MKYSITLLLAAMAACLIMQAAPSRRKATAVDQQAMTTRVTEALARYDLDMAAEILDQWESNASRAKQELAPEFDELTSRRLLMENMLERVEALPVVRADTLGITSMHETNMPIRLGQSSGSLYGARWFDSPPALRHDSLSNAHIPAAGREIFWSGPDDKGKRTLYQAGFLLDGSLDNPQPVFDDQTNERFTDMTTPFLADDGLTLYFAGKDVSTSIGGYDIYRAVRPHPGAGFSAPSNLGMPYNSPADDMLFCLDSEAGIGYFASKRAGAHDSIVIYTFVPNATRINRDASLETQTLTAYAAINDIASSRPDGFDLSRYNNQAVVSDDEESLCDRFDLYIPARKSTYHTLDDFTSSKARAAMEQVIQAYADLDSLTASLEDMRSRWSAGNHSLAQEIRRAENQLKAARQRVINLQNRVIELEGAQ